MGLDKGHPSPLREGLEQGLWGWRRRYIQGIESRLPLEKKRGHLSPTQERQTGEQREVGGRRALGRGHCGKGFVPARVPLWEMGREVTSNGTPQDQPQEKAFEKCSEEGGPL